MKKILLLLLCLAVHTSIALAQQAELHIDNNSGRTLTVKIMNDHFGANDHKYSTLSIEPYGSAVEYFAQTGNYYLKTQATKKGTTPIYKKGDPFNVYVGRDGYSVLTITYSITESNVADPLGGKQISKAEFDKD